MIFFALGSAVSLSWSSGEFLDWQLIQSTLAWPSKIGVNSAATIISSVLNIANIFLH